MSPSAQPISITPPEQGQLVEVRNRRFVVASVLRSSLAAGGQEPAAPQHLIGLSSIDDEGYGEELEVIWELEPGARVHERAALPKPTAFDSPERLETFLNAVRWGAVSSADVRTLQAPFRSGITIEDYQLDPVVRAVQMPRVSLLIADDVGLGKTIEAGLVAEELLLRHRVRTMLVVSPSALQLQWRDQMRDKFGLEFRIVDSELMRELRRKRGIHVNPWSHFPRLITSMDFLKRERPLRLMREVLPSGGEATYPRRFDLLIVDEAHNVAPSGSGRYAQDSNRTTAIRTLVPHFEHKLFLTATPHNGYSESFTALLELLDDQRFARGVAPDREQLGAVMVRRLKSEISPGPDGKPRFAKRQLEALPVQYPASERRAHEALREYSELRQSAAGSGTDRMVNEFVLKLLKKRLFSSPAAFAKTVAKHQKSLGTKTTTTDQALVATFNDLDEDFSDDDLREQLEDEAMASASARLGAAGNREHQLLSELRTWSEDASTRSDAKAQELIAWLNRTLKAEGSWSDRRVIIFTEYRATQNWLAGLLSSAGFADGERLLLLHGGMDPKDRERVKAAFQTGPEKSAVRILLATDAASEGIDLQNHCSRLVHYEIPWNPVRLEQRNGRIDRHGQREPIVEVFHFVGARFSEAQPQTAVAGDLDGDLEFLMRAALKVDRIREDLGKVGPVIAAQVEEAMLGKRARLDTVEAERGAEPVRSLLRVERRLREQLQRAHERLEATRADFHLSPEAIHDVVALGLELAGQPPLREAKVPGLWPDPTGRRQRCPVFHLPLLRGSWASAAEGLAHPHTGEIRPVVFDDTLVDRRDDLVLVHLNHRLVQLAQGLLRAEVWAAPGEGRLHRVTARTVPEGAVPQETAIAHGRLVILGADGRRLHEELVAAGIPVGDGAGRRLNVTEVQQALDAPGRAVEGKWKPPDRWEAQEEKLLAALDARAKDRAAARSKELEERCEKEVHDLNAVLEELRRSILTELEAAGPEQLTLFSLPEHEQFERNRDSLRARASAIPDEARRETEALKARYAGLQWRLFPVALTFLIPQTRA